MRHLTPLLLLAACAPEGAALPDQAPPPIRIEETFISEARPADVLLIVDNSGSMAEEQALLSRDATALADAIAALGGDIHVGVTTTDADDPRLTGRLRGVGGTLWADGLTPNLAQWLSQAVMVGTDGSPTEQGLHVMATALTDAGAIADNAGFLRADADLHVLTITDEADWSPARGYATGLSMLKSGGFESFFHLNAGPASTGTCFAEKPRGYNTVNRRIGGVLRNICDARGEFLAAVAHELLLRSSGYVFDLSAEPDAATLEVTVDEGAGAMPLSPGDYSYDPATGAITIDVPLADGATVTVAYAP